MGPLSHHWQDSRHILFGVLTGGLYVVGAALVSYFLLRSAPQTLKMAALAFVAGLLTVAAVEDMLQEAHEAHEDSRRSVLAFVGGFALFTLVSAGLGAMVRAG